MENATKRLGCVLIGYDWLFCNLLVALQFFCDREQYFPNVFSLISDDQEGGQDELICEAVNHFKNQQITPLVFKVSANHCTSGQGGHVRPVNSFTRPYQTGGNGMEKRCLLRVTGG